jgi:protein-disulfide isomerase-like protein with CxxC motif
VHLNILAFVPNQDLEEKMAFLSMNVHDHAAAAVNNLNGKNEAMLERCVYYDGLTAENVEILHQLAKQNGMNAINAINQRAAALKATQTHERRQSDTQQRMNFGVYFYHENADKKSPAKEN